MFLPAPGITPLVTRMLWNKGGQSDPPDTNQQANDPNHSPGKASPPVSIWWSTGTRNPVAFPCSHLQNRSPIFYLKSSSVPSPPTIYESTP